MESACVTCVGSPGGRLGKRMKARQLALWPVKHNQLSNLCGLPATYQYALPKLCDNTQVGAMSFCKAAVEGASRATATNPEPEYLNHLNPEPQQILNRLNF